MSQQVQIRMLKEVAIESGTTYASEPVGLHFVRHGTVQLISIGNATGGSAKLQGSNVVVSRSRAELNNALLNWGGLAPDDTGWVDLGVDLDFIAGVPLKAVLREKPGEPFDMHWIRLVVTIAGPGVTTLNAWAKFKSGN